MKPWVEKLARGSPHRADQLDRYRLAIMDTMKGYGTVDEGLCESFARLGVDLASTLNRELSVNHVHAALREGGES